MSLSSLKERIQPLSQTKTKQLHCTQMKTSENDLNFLESNVYSDKTFYQYSKINNESDVVACSSNVNSVKYKRNTDDKSQPSESIKSSICPAFDKDNSLKAAKSKVFHTSVETNVKSPLSETFKINQKHITYLENKPKSPPDRQYDGQGFNKLPEDKISVSKNADNHIKEAVLCTSEFKERSSAKQNTSLKKPDNNQPNQMKTKLKSMWNNVKYGWRMKREVNLKVDSAVWLLGRCYHNKLNDSSCISQDVSRQLKLDLLSKIYLTYRINFQIIPGTEFVSDSGWGCMLRCGQMMMAQALVCHFLNRDWRITSDQPVETKNLYKMILRWFGDSLSDTCPFSLHYLVSLGVNYGRKAGDWYGPTHVAQVLRDALYLSQESHPQLTDICMYVALDGIVFKQDVEDLCHPYSVKTCETLNTETFKESSTDPECQSNNIVERSNLCKENNSSEGTNNFHLETAQCLVSNAEDQCPSYSEFGPPSFNTSIKRWKSLILFVSVRLGNDRINPFYIPCLKSLLAYDHCIGIIGGRPKHALYFIGWQDDKLIHMDPHACQPAVDVEKDDFSVKSFHSSSIRTMSFTEMDPSCAIGFYFRLEEEYRQFIDKFSEITAPLKRNLDYPVFALAEGRRIDVEEVDSCGAYMRPSFSSISNKSYKEEDDDDDYILL